LTADPVPFADRSNTDILLVDIDATGLRWSDHLKRRIAQADAVTGCDPWNELWQLCGLPPTAVLPSAMLSWWGDAGVPAEQPLLHADPVRLLPDRDRLLVAPAPRLRIGAHPFVAVFNRHFAEDGISLQVSPAGRWYLAIGDRPPPQFAPLHAALGRDAELLLPLDAATRWWRGMLTETQMLLQQWWLEQGAEADASLLEFNALWLHGGGDPAGDPGRAISCLHAEHGFAAGLAHYADLDPRPITPPWTPGAVVVIEAAEQSEEVAAMLHQGIEQLLAARRHWRLLGMDGRGWRWRPHHAWRIWRAGAG
jgi:hypothetical protein